jgi:hypothetical protein
MTCGSTTWICAFGVFGLLAVFCLGMALYGGALQPGGPNEVGAPSGAFQRPDGRYERPDRNVAPPVRNVIWVFCPGDRVATAFKPTPEGAAAACRLLRARATKSPDSQGKPCQEGK